VDVRSSPARSRFERQVLLSIGGEKDRHRLGMCRRNRTGRLDAADAGHHDVHQDEVGPE
jgi:hypothetical protein